MSLRSAYGWLGVAVVAAWLVAAPGAAGQVAYIDTVAGTGAPGAVNGDARQATFNSPYQLSLLGDGSILVADYGGHRIRKVSPAGVVSTVAGTGAASSGADGGQATSTAVNAPLGVTVAPDGETFYVAEGLGHRIRRVGSDGTITTITGGSGAGSSGDGGAAAAAKVNNPYGLAIGPGGDLYFADQANGRVRRVTAGSGQLVDGTGTITTIASGFNQPTGVAVNEDGSLVVAAAWAHRIYSVSPGGVVTVLAGTGSQCGAGNGSTARCGDGGPATDALLGTPHFVTGDGAGGYFFSDRGTYRFRHISQAGTISTVAGTGSGTGCTATALCGDGGFALAAQFLAPSGLALAPDGSLYVADFNLHRIRAISPLPSTAPDGPAGPTGPQGPAGPQGSAGADGTDGADGAGGADGANGSDGASGADGIRGSDGPDGRDGTEGAVGAPGVNGRDGTWNDLVAMKVLLPAEAIMSRPARRAWVRLFVSGASEVEVTLRRNGRVVKSVKRQFKRIGRKRFYMGRLGRGRYEVRVVAVAVRSGGAVGAASVDRDSARLVVR